MKGKHTLSADLEFNTDEWDIDDADYSEEFKEAVETVRNDHDAEVWVDSDSLYKLLVRWNDKTKEVRFDVFAISHTFIVKTDGENDD